MDAFIPLIARACLSLIFIVSGVRQIMFRDKVQAEMARHGIPATRWALAAAVSIELVAGTALLAGYQTPWAALALIGFTIVSTLCYYRDLHDRESLLHVMKNIAIVGGLMLAAVTFAGDYP